MEILSGFRTQGLATVPVLFSFDSKVLNPLITEVPPKISHDFTIPR